MGTAGLVGQIMTWQTMIQTEPAGMVLAKILVIQILLPRQLLWQFQNLCARKAGSSLEI